MKAANSSAFNRVFRAALDGRASAREAVRLAMDDIVAGGIEPLRLAAWLGALAARGPTAEELAGIVDALDAHAVRVPDVPAGAVDTCGTGGDGLHTVNLSTGAALVAAAAGVPVAKHGNAAVSSRSGSADVLRALGIPVDLAPAEASAQLRAHGFAFLFAPRFHPAMAAVAPVRRALAARTVFNLVGPLCNPAGVSRQVVGVYAPHLVPLVASTLALRGARRALVVCGAGPMDELNAAGPAVTAWVENGEIVGDDPLPATWPGVEPAPLDALRGGDARENAARLRSALDGEPGAVLDAIVLNAAAALWVAGRVESPVEGVELARETIDSGRAAALLERLGSEGVA